MIKKRKRILLVEDDSAIIDIYKTIIKTAKFELEVATSGAEAIKRIKEIKDNIEAKIDIILIDLILPDINGIEIFRAIKENNAIKDTKIFILTNQKKDFVDWPSDDRPDEFLIKADTPPTHLLELIKKYLT